MSSANMEQWMKPKNFSNRPSSTLMRSCPVYYDYNSQQKRKKRPGDNYRDIKCVIPAYVARRFFKFNINGQKVIYYCCMYVLLQLVSSDKCVTSEMIVWRESTPTHYCDHFSGFIVLFSISFLVRDIIIEALTTHSETFEFIVINHTKINKLFSIQKCKLLEKSIGSQFQIFYQSSHKNTMTT